MTNVKNYILVSIAVILLLCIGIVGCSFWGLDKGTEKNLEEDEYQDLIVVGFSQPGAESAWRVALTESVKSAFVEEAGYRLIYKDGQNKQDNQIKDIRTFIQQGVDYIILAPIIETGWDQVLEEAKAAGIPVIVCDRAVIVSNESLYTAFAGSNFRVEGAQAVSCIESLLKERGENVETVEVEEEEITTDDNKEESSDTPPVDELLSAEEGSQETNEEASDGDENIDYFNIVHIQGTMGSSAQLGRTKALEEAVEAHPNWRIIEQECGEFTKAKARESMTEILERVDVSEIDLVYCENDEEAYGVMAALNEKGYSYGVNGDIIIVSFDGTNMALTMCMEGLINIEVECNPLQGQYLFNIINKLNNGEKVPKIAYIDESYFTPEMLTPEFIGERQY